MPSFRDQVNANIPIKKTEKELEDELKLNILKDVEKVADLIRVCILGSAQKYTGDCPFDYKGILFSNLFSKSSQTKEKSATLFSTEKKEWYVSKGKYADLFVENLRNILAADEIFISDLKCCTYEFFDEDYSVWYGDSYFSKFRYKIVDKYDKQYKILSEFQPYTEPIRVVEVIGNYDTSYISYYNNRRLLFREDGPRSKLWIGVQIRYKMK